MKILCDGMHAGQGIMVTLELLKKRSYESRSDYYQKESSMFNSLSDVTETIVFVIEYGSVRSKVVGKGT